MQIAVIESNPEQSKHLETARMKVAGLELDLVNLRSEKYADQTSRIPTMEFGTPEQDALRCSTQSAKRCTFSFACAAAPAAWAVPLHDTVTGTQHQRLASTKHVEGLLYLQRPVYKRLICLCPS